MPEWPLSSSLRARYVIDNRIGWVGSKHCLQVPLLSLHTATNSTVDPQLRTMYNRLHKLQAVNQYGLFKQMPVVRKEIILEGSDNLDGPWAEYNFLYKPGNVNHSLPFVGK